MLKSEIRVQPARAFIQTRYGDDCEAIAAQVLPDAPVQEAVQQLQSWNLFSHSPSGRRLDHFAGYRVQRAATRGSLTSANSKDRVVMA